MMPTLTEMDEVYLKECHQLKSLMDRNKDENGRYTHGGEDIGETRKRNDAINAQAIKVEEAREALKQAKRIEALAEANEQELKDRRDGVRRPSFDGNGGMTPGDEVSAMISRQFAPGGMPGLKSIGQHFVESRAYKEWRPRQEGQSATAELDLSLDQALAIKTTLASTGLTSYMRPPGVVLLGQQVPVVVDLLAKGTTTAPTIRYLRENTYTNAATTVAEGATKPEAAFDLLEVDSPVRKIGVVAKITDEMFADYPTTQSYVDARMLFMVQQVLDAQVLNGNGTAPNLRGILATTGILTDAQGIAPDNVPDTIFRAITHVRFTGFFEPDGVVMNPIDWQGVRLLKTTDGLYIWGSPADAGPERIWGKPVVQTVTIAAKTALVGAFQIAAQLFQRSGIDVAMTNSNVDDFVKNLLSLRVEGRWALAVYRPAGFSKVTLT